MINTHTNALNSKWHQWKPFSTYVYKEIGLEPYPLRFSMISLMFWGHIISSFRWPKENFLEASLSICWYWLFLQASWRRRSNVLLIISMLMFWNNYNMVSFLFKINGALWIFLPAFWQLCEPVFGKLKRNPKEIMWWDHK